MSILSIRQERLQQSTRIAITVGLCIAAAVFVWFVVGPRDEPPQVANATILVRREAPRESDPEELGFTPAPVARLTVPPRVYESKALDFELSAASRDPHRQFHAYELARDCAIAHLLSESARTQNWLPGRPAEPFDSSACGDLKPGQWEDVQQRQALLREASLAGVHGAWFALWQEGPDGPLRTLADGTEFREWEARARVAAMASADPFVYAQEAQEWRHKEPQRALIATVIYRETLSRRGAGPSFDPSADPEVIELASTLDRAVAQTAIAAGHAFVANAIKP